MNDQRLRARRVQGLGQAAENPDEVRIPNAERFALENKYDRQLHRANNKIKPLADQSFHELMDQLTQVSSYYNWPPVCYDIDGAPPTRDELDEIVDMSRHDLDYLESWLALKTARALLTDVCHGHELSSSIKDVPVDDPTRAFTIMFEYFHPRTVGGRNAANAEFTNMTMAKEKTNITGWIAAVRLRARILVSLGGEANDETQVARLLTGLLPEFKPEKDYLDRREGLTMNEAVLSLTNFARSNNLMDLSRGASKINTRVFTAEDASKSKEACRGWAKFDCRFGDGCRYDHSGPGGLRPPGVRPKKTKINPVSTTTQGDPKFAAYSAAAAAYAAAAAGASAPAAEAESNHVQVFLAEDNAHSGLERTRTSSAPPARLPGTHTDPVGVGLGGKAQDADRTATFPSAPRRPIHCVLCMREGHDATSCPSARVDRAPTSCAYCHDPTHPTSACPASFGENYNFTAHVAEPATAGSITLKIGGWTQKILKFSIFLFHCHVLMCLLPRLDTPHKRVPRQFRGKL